MCDVTGSKILGATIILTRDYYVFQIDRILADFHGHETEGGHAGGKRVQREIAQKFYWLPTILTFTRGWGRNIFVSFKPPTPGTEPRTLA